MHTWDSGNGYSVLEQGATIKEKGGYSLIVTMQPVKWWSKLFLKLGFSIPEPEFIEIVEGYVECSYVPFQRNKAQKNKFEGIFETAPSKKTIRITIDSEAFEGWELRLTVTRLFS